LLACACEKGFDHPELCRERGFEVKEFFENLSFGLEPLFQKESWRWGGELEDSSVNKVCYVSYREHPETVIENFSRFIAESGFDVTLVLYKYPDHKTIEEGKGRKIFRISLPTIPAKMHSRAVFTLKTADFLSKNDFSIVHFHNSCEYFGFARLLTSSKARFIYHTTSHPISESRVRIAKRKALHALQCLLMDSVIVQSQELKDRLPIIRSLARSVVIPVGYNGRLFGPLDPKEKERVKPLGIDDERLVLAYSGSMAYSRQLERLIEGFALAKRLHNDLLLLMIGDGVALEDLRARARALGIEGDVVFTRRVPYEKMVHYLRSADIGVSFIPINESYNYNPPLKTFEYLACGLPVIATRTVSNAKIVIDGFNGILIDNTSEDLCRAISNLAYNASAIGSMRKNASRSVREFDFENITNSMLIPLYRKLLSR
jgi:glycosyltransferase involved in cell wall biosynthesis